MEPALHSLPWADQSKYQAKESAQVSRKQGLSSTVRASTHFNTDNGFQLMPLVHVTDLTEYYALLAEALIQQKNVPTRKEGYYMVLSHSTSWWDILDVLAKRLHARGFVDEPTTYVWPSDELAAEAFEMPIQFAHSIFNSGYVVSFHVSSFWGHHAWLSNPEARQTS